MKSNEIMFTVGGQEYFLGPLAFWSLEKCWPDIEKLGNPEISLFERMHCCITVFACAIVNEPAKIPADWVVQANGEMDDEATIKRVEAKAYRALTKIESDNFFLSFAALLKISGFSPSGEGQAAVENGSTGTGSPLSQNSSDLASVEATGTA